MTTEEENRLLRGPFPWRGPGFLVTSRDLVPDLPPSINWKKRAYNYRREKRWSKVKEIHRDVYEDVSDLSRSELQATVEMTREELALRWDRLESEGEEVTAQFEELRDWIGERLRDAYREEPEDARWPFSDRAERLRPWNEIMRTGITGGSWGTQHFRVMIRTPNATTFYNDLRTANTLLVRYRALRHKRIGVALGGSGTGDYDPSPSARKALSTVARLDREHDGLAEMDIRDVWSYVEEQVVGLVNARANVRQDMRGRNKAPDRYPENTEELLELAQEVASERSQTFANRPKP